MKPKTFALRIQVSQARLAEWLTFLKRVGPTAQNPIAGDRVMVYARYGFDQAERIKAAKARKRRAEGRKERKTPPHTR